MKHPYRKNVSRALASIACVLCLGAAPAMHAAAYTADDIAAKARASGWPEYLIQAGYNEAGGYTQEQLDQAYASVSSYDEQTGQMIAASLGIRYQPGSSDPAESTTESGSDSAASAETSAPAAATVTKTDGTTEERISKSDFIHMSIEEKRTYIASLTEESQEAFMAALSPEERNSILKQLPADQKAQLMQTYIDAAKGMGMNVSVDQLTGSDVSLTIRNEEGQVIGKTAIGTVIDETGISHTVPLVTAFSAALLSVGVLAALNRKNREH